MSVSVEQVAESMFEMVKEYHGKRNLKALEKYGDEGCDKKLCKQAIRTLMDTGRCVYNYVGGSYIALPPES